MYLLHVYKYKFSLYDTNIINISILCICRKINRACFKKKTTLSSNCNIYFVHVYLLIINCKPCLLTPPPILFRNIPIIITCVYMYASTDRDNLIIYEFRKEIQVNYTCTSGSYLPYRTMTDLKLICIPTIGCLALSVIIEHFLA